MKVKSIGKYRYSKGSMTLEILLAFAIVILCMSAVISLSFGSQSLTVDAETNTEAISKAKKMLEDARDVSRQDYLSITSNSINETVGPLTYLKKLDVQDITACKKIATSTVSWTNGGKSESITFATYLGNVAEALSLGGDCISDSPTSGWTNPQRFASDTFSPGKPTAIDLLNKVVYMGEDKNPFFAIANTNGAILGQSGGLFVSFSNGFVANKQINDLDAINWTSPGGTQEKYIFAAEDSSTNQLQVIKATTMTAPTSAALVSLSPCVAGSAPQGWKVYYYGNRLYLTTRFTAGPEFHIFDVTTPSSPSEIGIGACKGTDLGDTVNDFIVKDQMIGGVTRRFVYMATDELDKELRVFEVTGDVVTEIFAANQNLPGAQNGESVYSVGNKLYLGRQSTPGGPDLYVYDIKDPTSGLTLLGSKDIGTGVIGIRVAGNFAFISTPKVNQEFQVWNIYDPNSISNIAVYNFGNVVDQGIEYEPDFIYATGQSTPNFQILYSP